MGKKSLRGFSGSDFAWLCLRRCCCVATAAVVDVAIAGAVVVVSAVVAHAVVFILACDGVLNDCFVIMHCCYFCYYC